MAWIFEGDEAFGRPGREPRWAHSAKEAVGTAYSTSSRVWFTISRGNLTEVYWPTVDAPQTRDLEFFISDGETFAHSDRRDLRSEISQLDANSLGYRVVSRDPKGRYQLVKEIISDPHLSCVLLRTRLEGDESWLKRLRLYATLSPHLESRGGGNTAARMTFAGRTLLVAKRGSYHVAFGASVPFRKTSCGFVGVSDGRTDLDAHKTMLWEFGHARDGNVALTAELDLSKAREFTLALAFGFRLQGAVTTLLESLGLPFEPQKERFQEQWRRASGKAEDLAALSGDRGRLYRISHSLLLSHEDKTYPGAMIASLSIPWGTAHGDDDGLGGYHLVWTRDMCQSASGLMACGNYTTPLRALIYLAATQLPHGGFYQNFWINGDPFWTGIQLDETAFPVILAWRLAQGGHLKEFDPSAMVRKAAGHLIRQGPVTPQERWEENSGYSPSTLAAVIAALICAADFSRRSGDAASAVFMEEYADFLESHLEEWMVASGHYIRLLPVEAHDVSPNEDPETGVISLRNQPPGERWEYPARDIIDGGFLELVRYGVRRADDPVIAASVKAVDEALRVETPSGPGFRRYNHDGYGQRPDGGPFLSWGKGRLWPLLSGERGHYELAAGRDPAPFLRALEKFASRGGMLPEQSWDAEDMPAAHLYRGRPTGAAMPLMWAHAEYVKLLRSARDGAVFDFIAPVGARYLGSRGRKDLEVWKFNRQARRIRPGTILRVIAEAPFSLRWSDDEWRTAADAASAATALGLHYVDLPAVRAPAASLKFTFFWPKDQRWEGRDFEMAVASRPA